MISFFGFLIFSYLIYRLYQHFLPSPNINPKGKYVLISGCDTGFGHQVALELDKQGFNVLAGVYLPDSVNSLKNKLSSQATVFPLDITKQDDINAAFELVQNKTKVLHALVNNAGIAIAGHVDWTTVETMRRVMDVNYFGHVTMTKTFLPLLIAKRNSRVINISSMCGYIALPGSSGYCSSKYALEAFSDCLRREMIPWNLHVSIVEPGTMRTTIMEGLEDNLRNVWLRLPSDVQQRWGKEYFDRTLKMVINSPFIKYAESANKVVRVINHGIVSSKPRIRYRPGWQSNLVFFPLSLLPTFLLDKLIALGFRGRPAGIIHQSD
ncbi:unnamed protein product [Adineta ricciae]|uniref:Uncharacterized protein n=1 Tax=Adineta ricciae TaxID=249248 RepID=A0A813NPU7_ADIRI|nr:unnamed protein product [Adineta ricciae]CAF1142211.1 unnamed protein product [Adineta ricciae]